MELRKVNGSRAVYSLAEQAAADLGLSRWQQQDAAREAVAVYGEGFTGWRAALLGIRYARKYGLRIQHDISEVVAA